MMSRPAFRPANRRGAFTLIELLTVIAIIAILAALLLSTAGYVQEKAGNSRAEAEIKAMEAALESYKIDNGTYPTDGADGGDTSTKVLLDELSGRVSSNAGATTPKRYFEVPIGMLPTAGKGASYDDRLKAADRLDDPFGNPYHYKFPGDKDRSGVEFFDLFSMGKKNKGVNTATDKATTDRWIKNW